MKFLSLEPFVPSGADFESSKQLFLDLGFHINWEIEGYAGFQRDECRFILQHYDKTEFAENFMLSVKVEDVDELEKFIKEKRLTERYSIRTTKIKQQPYGRELNLIDIAGVCWHFVQQ